MDIINLINHKEYDVIDDNVSNAAKSFRVTAIRQGVKNPNRVNVFINGKYSFSLEVSQVVDFKLKIGQELTPEQIIEYKNASELGKLYQRTLEWVLMRPRSIRETRDYLKKKLKVSFEGNSQSLRGPSDEPREDGRDERPAKDCSELFDDIIDRLISRGYLDDQRFAEYYVENRFVRKGISGKRLKMELLKKGVSSDIIYGVLGGRDDEEEIKKIIAKKRAKYDDEKLISYLCRQGFDYQLALESVRNYEKD